MKNKIKINRAHDLADQIGLQHFSRGGGKVMNEKKTNMNEKLTWRIKQNSGSPISFKKVNIGIK